MENKQNSNAGTRRRGRPIESVEQIDIESDTLFPHIPLTTHREDKKDSGEQDLTGDYGSISLLMLLYILQGIPLGLSGSLPMLLQTRKVSYSEQAIFSFVYWPFSVKLLWAPLVDSIYSTWFGRRKTWLIPIQYVIGLSMMIISTQAQDLMGGADGTGKVDIMFLTVVFFMLNFLAATQDIAVDGWALTMLSRRNIGWASTCNSVGQTAGYFLGNVLFLALESADFCNNYIRSTPHKEGVVTLSSFLWFWGIVFLVTTTLVGIFKKEYMDLDADPDQGVVETYRILGNVIRLPSVISYSIILLTSKVAFAATDALTSLKLIEAGMPKERLALFVVPIVPLQIVLPLLISKYTSGPKPMEIWLKAYPYRMVIGAIYCFIVYWATITQPTPGEFPWYFYVVALTVYGVSQVTVYCMFVAQMAFHAKISDPAIGGTYMTLLNTVANLGGNWPSTLALWLVDYMTWKSCSNGGSCDSKEARDVCEQGGGSCSTQIEGYYILTAIGFVVGILWMRLKVSKVRQMGEVNEQAWKYKAISS